MMFVEQCAEVFLPLLLLTTVFAMVDSNITVSDVFSTPSLSMSIQGSISGSVIQSKLHSSHINPAVTATMSSTGSQPSITTATPSNKDKKLETYIIIIIAACAAVFVFVVIILLLLCVCRRRRIQRLERERNLSYNNMNYESTVKFKIDGDRASGHVGSTSADDPFVNNDNTPTKTNNSPRRDAAGYEVVDLPSNKGKEVSPRQYENVELPRPSAKDGEKPDRLYENVTPMTSPSKDKSQPVRGYEEVFLTSPQESKKQKKNDKYYENVEPQNLR